MAKITGGVGKGRVGAVIVGAGGGKRLGGVEKAFLPVLGRPLMAYAVEAFQSTLEVTHICLVVAADSVARTKALVRDEQWGNVSAVVAGGAERPDSVLAGLAAVAPCEWVLIHDAARPLVTPELIRRTLNAATVTGAALAATPVRDTLKRAGQHGESSLVHATVDRSALWSAQTPQVFRWDWIRAAFDAAGEGAAQFTDDASLVEQLGHPVELIDAGIANLKVTLPGDVELVEALLQARQARALAVSSQVTAAQASPAQAAPAWSSGGQV